MAIDIALTSENEVVAADRNNYWRYYGLRYDPFTPYVKDNETLVFSRWEQYFDLLHYLCNSNNVLIATTGLKGVGKTLFKNQFISQLQTTTNCVDKEAEPTLEPNQMLQILVEGFKLNPIEADNTEELLEAYITQLQQAERTCVLVIDNAHQLPLTTVSMLFALVKLQSEAQMRLRIMLVGNQQLKDRLNQAMTDDSEQEIVHYLNLEPLSLDETQRYIKHRLTIAGLPAGIPLSAATIERIYHLSEGVPGRINAVTRQILIDAMQKPQLQAMIGFVKANRSLIVGASILALVVIWVLAFFAKNGSVPHWPALGFSNYFQKKQETVVKTEAVSTLHNVNVIVPSIVDNAPSVSLPPTANYPVSTSSESSSTTNPIINDVAPVLVKEELPKTIDSKIKPQLVTKSIEAKITPRTVLPVKADVTLSKLPKVDKPLSGNSVQRFLSSSPHHFTLQLIGLSHESAMKAFIAEQKLKNLAIYYRGTRAGKEWFTLVYGIYPTKEAALAAVKTLPQEVQAQKPWIKTIASVQHEIRQSS